MTKEPQPADTSETIATSPTEKFIKYVDYIVNGYPHKNEGDTDESTRSGMVTVSPNKTLVAEITNFASTLGPEHREILDDIYSITVRDGAGGDKASLTIGTLGIAIETRDGTTIDYTDLTKEASDAIVSTFIALNGLNILELN